MKQLLLFFFLILSPLISIQARSFIFDGINYNILSEVFPYSVSVDSLVSNKDNILIPPTVIYNDTNFQVTSIHSEAFNGCSNITSISIPNSVNFIGSQAFKNCTSLATITIGDSMNTDPQKTINIDSSAFNGCSDLSSLNIYIRIISNQSPFHNLPSLKNLLIGNAVTTIYSSLFSSLTGLSKVTLGNIDITPVNISVYMGAFNGSNHLDTLELNCNFTFQNFTSGYKSPFSTISCLLIGDKVSSIGDYTFIGSTNLKTIKVPNAVTFIGQSTFAECSSLTEITLGSSVAKIGVGTFTECNSLLNINIDPANTTYSSINGIIFSKDQLTLIQYPVGRSGDYEIPDFIKIIGSNAFMSCQGLQSVFIPESITSLQSFSFANCTRLNSVTIGGPNCILSDKISIAGNAFTGCLSLKSIHLNKNFSFTDLNNSPFKNLNSLTTLFIGNGILSLPDYSFAGCSGLKNLQLGQNNNVVNNLLSISVTSFSGCANLTTLELNKNINIIGYKSPFLKISTLWVGDSVTFIPDYCFQECSNLSTVRLPPSVKTIGNYAFYSCSKLLSIELLGVQNIGTSAFGCCSSLASIVIPNTVKTMKDYAFNQCTSLSSVILSDSITQIASGTFMTCSGLVSIKLGTSLAIIGSSAFEGCSTMQTIQFPSSLTNIGNNAFKNCSELQSLFIPSTVNKIGTDAFINCSSIDTLIIGDTDNPGLPLQLPVYPFAGCHGVKTLIYNKDIVNDPSSSPFSSLSSLESVIISNHVTHLNSFAFCNCSKLISVIIPNSVTTIEAAAFQKCSSLTDVKLPIDLKALSQQIFHGCTNLKSLDIPSTVTAIGSYALHKCTSLTSLTIPKSVVSIGGIALNSCTRLNELIVANPVPPTTGDNCFNYINATTCTLYVPTGSKSAYQNDAHWKYFTNIYEMEMQDSISSVTTQEIPSLSFYPNPVKEGFYIDRLSETGTLAIINLNGSIIFSKQVCDNEYVSMSTLPEGVYILKIVTKGICIEQKILKKY